MMDEIEKIIKSLMTDTDKKGIEYRKKSLKRLIKLVENEQMNNCENAIVWKGEKVNKAPRVSQQIDWEEL